MKNNLLDPVACARQAERLFDKGQNCAQAVLQATTGETDPKLLAMLKGFRGGIGDSGCVCGALTGGGNGAWAGESTAQVISPVGRLYETIQDHLLPKFISWLPLAQP